MDGDAPVGAEPNAKQENYLQRTVAADSSAKDVKRRISRISEASGDDISLGEMLDTTPKMDAKTRAKIEENYAIVESSQKGINEIQDKFRKDSADGNTEPLSAEEVEVSTHKRDKLAQDMQFAEKNINSSIKKIESRQSKKARVLNAGSNLTAYQQGNMLAGVPIQEKNLIGDIIATVTSAIRHPIKMATNIPQARLASEFRKTGREIARVRPQTVSEVPKYIIRSALSPVYAVNNALSNIRGGMSRNEFAKTELIKSGNKNPTKEEIRIQAMKPGNAREIVVNLNKNVGAAMSDPYKAAAAADAYFKVLDEGTSHKDLAKFAEETSKTTGILQGMMSGKNNNGEVTPMSLLINNLYPFTNPAINATKNAIYRIDPRKASQVNEIRKVIRNPTQQNISKLAKMAGSATSIAAIAMLLEEGIIDYTDYDDEDGSRPAGWTIKTGENTYTPARAFGVFEPFIVATGVTHKVMSGEVDSIPDAVSMAANSLPYMSSNEFYAQAAKEQSEGEMWGYGTQSQVVSRTKNLVPFVNNGLDRWTDRNSGKSTDTLSSYVSKENDEGESVPDFMPWLKNSVKSGFGFNDGLKPSYTPAGQRRTSDNQGAFVNKTINDPNTAEFNESIVDLVKYGKDNGLGESGRDMFNTYPDGKTNHFKPAIDAVTFSDVEDGESPDSANKLKKSDELYDLSQQMYNGVYGDTEAELLTLDGKNLKSNASAPLSKTGNKNSNLPISMQSIKNAVAQTDLPEEQRTRLYELGGANTELFNKVKSKEISSEQYKSQKAKIESEYVSILDNSENYQKMESLFGKLKDTGFFEKDGLGSTKSGQTYLWNALNSLLGDKGKTPAANYPEDGKGWTPWGRGGGSGSRAVLKTADRGSNSIKWSPVQARKMAEVAKGQYTPFKATVKLGNAVKKDKTQNYTSRSF